MITRFVKMTFREDQTQAFLDIFNESKHKIRSFEGCSHLQLLRSKSDPRIFFTHSTWESEADLENYRNSGLFLSTWTRTKALFAEKAEAWSLEDITGGPLL